MPGHAPFCGLDYVIGSSRAGAPTIALRQTTRADAEALGPELAAMNPWARLGISGGLMTGFLAASDANKRCFSIWHGATRAGVIVVRSPWLAGPYLNLLGVLAPYQQKGIGRAALAWLEAEAVAAGARNCFLCVSAFNTAAHAFYRRNGYDDAVPLTNLVKDGEDEILMRKRLS